MPVASTSVAPEDDYVHRGRARLKPDREVRENLLRATAGSHVRAPYCLKRDQTRDHWLLLLLHPRIHQGLRTKSGLIIYDICVKGEGRSTQRAISSLFSLTRLLGSY